MLSEMVNKLPCIDVQDLTTTKIPKTLLAYFRDTVPASSDTKRWIKIAQFINKNYGLTPFQMMDDNLTKIIQRIVKEVKE